MEQNNNNTYTYENTGSGGLMPNGDYEAVIERMEVKTTSTGKEKLSIMYRVRSDVEQQYKNKCIFEDIWHDKERPNMFNIRRINMLLGTQAIEPGTTFNGVDEIIEFLLGSYLIIHVNQVFDDYRNEDVNKVGWYKSSNYKPKSLGTSEKQTSIVDDEDLPF